MRSASLVLGKLNWCIVHLPVWCCVNAHEYSPCNVWTATDAQVHGSRCSISRVGHRFMVAHHLRNLSQLSGQKTLAHHYLANLKMSTLFKFLSGYATLNPPYLKYQVLMHSRASPLPTLKKTPYLSESQMTLMTQMNPFQIWGITRMATLNSCSPSLKNYLSQRSP